MGDGDGFFVAIVFIVAIIICAIGIAHLAGDFRDFDTIVEQCTNRGYIQNDDVRVICVIDKPDPVQQQ